MSVDIPAVIKKKRWLILSHGFNMDGRASSLTITDKIPYFLHAGIEPVVFSAITGIKDQRFPHYQYLAWGPAAFRFDFRHWIANKYRRGFFYKLTTRTVSILLAPLIGLEKFILGYSSQWSWAFPAFIHGLSLARQGKIDLIYSTGGAWSAHLAGLWLKKVTGLPLIVEVHDPLVIRKNPNDQGFEQPKNRDARFRHYLEKQLIRFSDKVWWFTDGALHYAKVRNPNLNTPNNAHGFVVTPGAHSPIGLNSKNQHQYSDKLNLCHFGSLAKDRSLSTILRALIPLFKKYPHARDSMRVHAYGAPLDPLTIEAIEKFGFNDVLLSHGRLEIDPITGKSGRQRVAERMREAEVLILLHGNDEWCAEYIPSKLYDYLWAGRPIWGITHRNPQLDQMLLDRGAYLSSEGDSEGISIALERIWLDWQLKKLIEPIWKPIGVEQAAYKIITEAQKIN
ncbi:glycosyltransferase [Polynucleobacter sp. UB-Siik-W21]|uniref:glycosyltransferase n=1 Tax=Polynucleobacter sp. UB-Siik-W21 TaxID=1855646 RepID=UPI002040122C|nr:glycosyltransferase [Polynucleobacter sp. UB-Siik-W21]